MEFEKRTACRDKSNINFLLNVEFEKWRLTTHYPDITRGTGKLVGRHLLETGQETKTNETTTWWLFKSEKREKEIKSERQDKGPG